MKDVLRLSLPMTLWLVGFSALYALHGLTCSRHWPADLAPRGPLIAAAALFIALHAGLVWAILHRPAAQPFVQRTATALAIAALGATLWTALPLLTLPDCR